jgi:single-strand DNA-binding protein
MSGFAINQLTISGNLTSDPELRHLLSGQALCKLRIANNERVKLADGSWISQPQYFDITIWGAIGEWVAANVTKGDQVVIAGRLRWREYDTATGDKRQAIDITADSIIPTPRSSPASADIVDTDTDDIPF